MNNNKKEINDVNNEISSIKIDKIKDFKKNDINIGEQTVANYIGISNESENPQIYDNLNVNQNYQASFKLKSKNNIACNI